MVAEENLKPIFYLVGRLVGVAVALISIKLWTVMVSTWDMITILLWTQAEIKTVINITKGEAILYSSGFWPAGLGAERVEASSGSLPETLIYWGYLKHLLHSRCIVCTVSKQTNLELAQVYLYKPQLCFLIVCSWFEKACSWSKKSQNTFFFYCNIVVHLNFSCV